MGKKHNLWINVERTPGSVCRLSKDCGPYDTLISGHCLTPHAILINYYIEMNSGYLESLNIQRRLVNNILKETEGLVVRLYDDDVIIPPTRSKLRNKLIVLREIYVIHYFFNDSRTNINIKVALVDTLFLYKDTISLAHKIEICFQHWKGQTGLGQQLAESSQLITKSCVTVRKNELLSKSTGLEQLSRCSVLLSALLSIFVFQFGHDT